MPIILCIACIVWFLFTLVMHKGSIATGRIAQEKYKETSDKYKDSITDAVSEQSLSEYIENNRLEAWKEADVFTEKLPTWEKVRSLGYEPHVASQDVLTVLMVERFGKLPLFKATLPMFDPPSYFSKKTPNQYNPILRDEFALAIENALRKSGNDIRLIIETREYDSSNRPFHRYYTMSKHILPSGERDDILKNKSANFRWIAELSPAERLKLDTGQAVYGSDFMGF